MQYTSNIVEELWQQLNKTITEYENATDDKRKKYKYLKQQDNSHSLDIVAQSPKLHIHLQSTIKNLKQDLYTLTQKQEHSITELKDQITLMNRKIHSLRQKSAMTRILDATQLKKLTIISGNVLKVKILYYQAFITFYPDIYFHICIICRK